MILHKTPIVTIFVRHASDCKYSGDEFCKRCNCRKHLRWSHNGKQHRMSAGTRSWGEAENRKRELEDQLAGHVPQVATGAMLLADGMETFKANKQAQGVKPGVLSMYARELKRLQDFSERRGLLSIQQALTIDNLIALRATWPAVYPSSYSRATVQKYLKHFVRFCFDAGWIDRVPKLSPIKVDEPETLPLTDVEYEKVLAQAEGKTKTLIKLMRWSGLAIRDASTLQRIDLHFDTEKQIFKIIRKRTKTREPLYIPIPKDVAEEVLAVLNSNVTYVFWNKRNEDSSEPRHSARMGEQVAEAFKGAGVRSEGHMVSHRLRATFAVDLLQKGVPLEHVSKLLGHTSVTTTERHYARWVKGRQDRLDALVSATWAKKTGRRRGA